MPFVDIEETIEIKKLKLIQNDSKYDYIMPKLFKGGGGIFVEIIDKFKSSDAFNTNIHSEINNMIELLKFSYYTACLPLGTGYPGFISDSSFELFPIIEANKDKSFEHKTPITNGVSNFLMKQEDYFRHKIILGNVNNVKIVKSFLYYFELIYDDCIHDENKLSILKLYNKSLRITDTNDCFDKIIFARASIETLIKIKGAPLSKKNYTKTFVEKIEKFIKSYPNLNNDVLAFYKDDVVSNNGLKISEDHLNTYMESLATARHNLVHENKITQDFITIEVYITWFPLFFLITFFKEDLQEKDLTRMILFLKLLQLDFELWNKRDTNTLSNKMTCLETYDQYTRSITSQLGRNEHENISYYLEGFNNCFKDR